MKRRAFFARLTGAAAAAAAAARGATGGELEAAKPNDAPVSWGTFDPHAAATKPSSSLPRLDRHQAVELAWRMRLRSRA